MTGLRRWKMRQPRRLAEQLSDEDRWDCVWGCGKSYRATSSRSIQRHASTCYLRSDGQTGDVDVKGLREQNRGQRKKRRTYQLFDTAADHSSDGGEEGTGAHSACSTPSSFRPSHHHSLVSSMSATQLMHDEMDMTAVPDEQLSWNTEFLDGPLDDTFQSFSQPHEHRHRQQQHQHSRTRPAGQLPRLGSQARVSRTFSLTSPWPPAPSYPSSSAFLSASSSSSAATSLLSSPPPLSWLPSASSPSVDEKPCQLILDGLASSPLPLAISSSDSAVGWAMTPPLSPMHQSRQPFTPLLGRAASPRAAPIGPAATAAVHTGADSAAQPLFFLPSSAAAPSPLSYPASSSTTSSLLAAPTSLPSAVQQPSLYEREQLVSEELCSLLTSLYSRHGMQHPVFQQHIVSPQLLQRALAIHNNHINNNHHHNKHTAATSSDSSSPNHPYMSSSSSVPPPPSASATLPSVSSEWQEGLNSVLSRLFQSSVCAADAPLLSAFPSW